MRVGPGGPAEALDEGGQPSVSIICADWKVKREKKNFEHFRQKHKSIFTQLIEIQTPMTLISFFMVQATYHSTFSKAQPAVKGEEGDC